MSASAQFTLSVNTGFHRAGVHNDYTEDTRLRLDLKGLPAGAYFVTLVTPQGSHTEKLVIGEF